MDPRASRSVPESPLLFAAGALFTIPVVSFVLSHLGPSIFFSRYFLPASLGWAIVIAHLVARLSALPARRQSTTVRWVMVWKGFVIGIFAFPLTLATGRDPIELPGSGLNVLADSLRGLPIVVEHAHDYLPAVHYARPEHQAAAARIAERRGEGTEHVGLWGAVLFPLDSAVAMSPASPLSALTDFRLLARRREDFHDLGIVSPDAILCGPERFLVLDREPFLWSEVRLGAEAAFSTEQIASEDATSLLLVTRVGACAPLATCCDSLRTTSGLR